jgi:hypothetical protein
MSASLEIRGIAELKQALANLPIELKGESTQIVLDTAYAAADDIRTQYPLGLTGNLRKGVRVVVKEIGALAVAAQVRSGAPHAHLWEFGTQARQTKLGWQRGRMPHPPAPVFIPTMIRYRRAMYAKLAALIQSKGLTVKVDEAA